MSVEHSGYFSRGIAYSLDFGLSQVAETSCDRELCFYFEDRSARMMQE
jgi:hypothetical protein